MTADRPASPDRVPAGAGASRRSPGARLAPLLALALAGCTVRGDQNEIVIDHLSSQPGVAQLMADNHCARFGKIARHVQMGMEHTSGVWLRQRTSVFACVDPAELPAAPGAKPKTKPMAKEAK